MVAATPTSHSTTSQKPTVARAVAAPTYTSGPGGTHAAHFKSGAVIPVSVGRARSYPGMIGESPPTEAFYSLLKAYAPGSRRVLDVGSGSGVGTRVLTSDFETVIGIDCDIDAVAFSREYASGAEFLVHDLATPPPIDPVDTALVCDVLGHAADPALLLRSLRQVLSVEAMLLIAEPRAYTAQQLRTPARRAFSRSSLSSFLVQAGFSIDSFAPEGSSFLMCVARPSPSSAWRKFGSGAAHEARGDLEAAVCDYESLTEDPSPDAQLEALVKLGRLDLHRKRGEAAATWFLRATEIAKTDSRALTGLSTLAWLSEAPADALRLAVAALETEPTDAEAAAALARAAETLGQLSDSLKSWAIATALAPAKPEYSYELARAAAELEDYKYGVSVLEQLRGYHGELGADFHVTLGWLLAFSGRTAEARLEARHGLLLDPEHSGAQDLLAHVEQSK